MTDFDVNRLLDMTIDAMDFRFMIGDVKDFLEFSEQNIDWQHRRELQSIALMPNAKDNAEYQHSLEQNADHRFQVSLPLRVRYSALLSFVTSVEWSVGYLNLSTREPFRPKRDKTNPTVQTLTELCSRAQVASAEEVADYEAMVRLRNCVVHAGGIVASYEFKEDLPAAAARIPGVTLESWHFFGPQVCIARNALDKPIERTARLVLELHTQLRERGLQK